jgi:hypothetical protein
MLTPQVKKAAEQRAKLPQIEAVKEFMLGD